MKKKNPCHFISLCIFPWGLDLCIKDTGYNDVSSEFMNCDLIMTKRRVFTRISQARLVKQTRKRDKDTVFSRTASVHSSSGESLLICLLQQEIAKFCNSVNNLLRLRDKLTVFSLVSSNKCS